MISAFIPTTWLLASVTLPLSMIFSSPWKYFREIIMSGQEHTAIHAFLSTANTTVPGTISKDEIDKIPS